MGRRPKYKKPHHLSLLVETEVWNKIESSPFSAGDVFMEGYNRLFRVSETEQMAIIAQRKREEIQRIKETALKEAIQKEEELIAYERVITDKRVQENEERLKTAIFELTCMARDLKVHCEGDGYYRLNDGRKFFWDDETGKMFAVNRQ
jgi:hypothetical protein